MKPILAILSLLVVLGISWGVLLSQSPLDEITNEDNSTYNVPGPDGSIPPVVINTPKEHRYNAHVAEEVGIPEGVDVPSILAQLAKQPLDQSESEWRDQVDRRFDVDPQKYRVQQWDRSIQSVTENDDGEIEFTVLASLVLTTNGLPISAGSTTEVYRLIPNGTLELIDRTPHRIIVMGG